MTVALSAFVPSTISAPRAGLGFEFIVRLVMDASMLQAGELLDLSSIVPTAGTVFGGVPIAETLNDGGFVIKYVRGATSASGLLQCYGMPAAAASGPLVLLSNGANVSAVDGQTWVFWASQGSVA